MIADVAGRVADAPAGTGGVGRHVAQTTPYAWPYDGDLCAGRLAFIVAGAQIAFADRSQGTGKVGETIERLAAAFRSVRAVVVVVRHHAAAHVPPERISRPPSVRATSRPVTLPPLYGAPDWELATAVAPGDVVVNAGGIDGFLDSGLDLLLRSRGIDHLCLAGYGAELAVDSTLRSANDRGYECLVVSDAVAPIDVRTGAAALASVTMSGGIFGALGTAGPLLVALTSEPSEISESSETSEGVT